MVMEIHKGFPCLAFPNAEAFQLWLEENYGQHGSIWLILYKKGSGIPSIQYQEALDELLCYGWIDSVPNKRDELSHMVLVSPRNPKSNWSKVNKDKVEKLLAEGRMRESGLRMIELAKATGTWSALESVDNLVVPEDLEAELQSNPPAFTNFTAFSNSSKRGILEWIFNAKTEATRQKRIALTAEMAYHNLKANHLASTNAYKEILNKS